MIIIYLIIELDQYILPKKAIKTVYLIIVHDYFLSISILINN